jgi:putative endonuclease
LGIYIYMLRCADGSYYVGSATGHDLSPRIDQHNAGAYPGYTFTRRPVVLVWSEYFDRITDGIAVEQQIKGWSRAKKEALIRSDWKEISTLPSSWRDPEAERLIRKGLRKSCGPFILRGSPCGTRKASASG